MFNLFIGVVTALLAVLGIVYFFVTERILRRHLNLECIPPRRTMPRLYALPRPLRGLAMTNPMAATVDDAAL